MIEPKGFGIAKRKAAKMLKRKDRLKSLLLLAGLRTVTSKERLKNTWEDMVALIRLVTSWVAGTYTKIPIQSIVMAVAAIIYFVNPLDVIPDFLLLWGLIDDVVVISFVMRSIKSDLDTFRAWENAHEKGTYKKEQLPKNEVSES